MRDDGDIKKDVEEELRFDPDLDATDTAVSVRDGVVMLTGFVKRYGDTDDDEFAKAHGTIPQRLLMMNGDLVDAKVREELLNASSQVAMFAPDDGAAVDTAYLTVLTRRPKPKEREYFSAKLAGTTGDDRRRKLADMYWVLFNSSEMSWNH